jgi:hypothetical protein
MGKNTQAKTRNDPIEIESIPNGKRNDGGDGDITPHLQPRRIVAVFHPVMAMTMTRPVVLMRLLMLVQVLMPTMTMIRENRARNEREITSATSLSDVSASLGMESTRLGGAHPDDVARNSHHVIVQFCNLFGKN